MEKLSKTIYAKFAPQMKDLDLRFRALFQKEKAIVPVGHDNPGFRRAVDVVAMPLIDDNKTTGRAARSVVSLDGFYPVLVFRAGTEDPSTVAMQICQNLERSIERSRDLTLKMGSQHAQTSAAPAKGEIPRITDIIAFLTEVRNIYRADEQNLGANLGILSLEQYSNLPPGKVYCLTSNRPLIFDLPPLLTSDGIPLPNKALTLDFRGEVRPGIYEVVATTDSSYKPSDGRYTSKCSVLQTQVEIGHDFQASELIARNMIPPLVVHVVSDKGALLRLFVRNDRAAVFVPDSSGLLIPTSDDFRFSGIF